MIAHGTEFEVRLERSMLRVALLEGAVSVKREGETAREAVKLRPNDVLTASGGTVEVHPAKDAQALVAWREGLLVFRDETLRAAVEETNRYGRTQIVIADHGIAELRVSGVFHVGQATAFAEALQHSLPVTIADSTPDRIVLTGN